MHSQSYLIKFNCAISILLPFLLLIACTSCYGTIGEQTKQSREIVEGLGIWFIEDGLTDYYKGKDLTSIEEHIKSSGAYLPTEIIIEKSGYLAEIRLASFWIRSIVTCYSRVSDDYVYEYWVIKFYSTREDVGQDEIHFLIAKSGGIDNKREIIHRSNEFFSKFTASDGTVIHFPVDSNKFVYNLEPWRYPDSFKGTELEDVLVVFENKKYIRKKTE